MLSAAPFQRICEDEVKFVPVTVSVKARLSAEMLVGESAVRAGAGLLMVKPSDCDVPPPGDGVCTATLAVPAVARSEAGICAVSEVLETKVVVKGEPFQSTCEAETNPEPATESDIAELPAVTLAGETEESVGAGLLMVKLSADDVPPPGDGV